MLVLSRKAGERVLIGNEIVVTVVRLGPNSVRLGIDAPQFFDVRREELDHERGNDIHVMGYLPTDPHIFVLEVGEASGDVGGMVREDEGD